jgi:hypothetical protein
MTFFIVEMVHRNKNGLWGWGDVTRKDIMDLYQIRTGMPVPHGTTKEAVVKRLVSKNLL